LEVDFLNEILINVKSMIYSSLLFIFSPFFSTPSKISTTKMLGTKEETCNQEEIKQNLFLKQ